MIRAPLIPPHFFDRLTSTVIIFIEVVGQNWSGDARLPTPLQLTVIQWGLILRWPQLSQITRVSEKRHIFLLEEDVLLGNIDLRCSLALGGPRPLHLQK